MDLQGNHYVSANNKIDNLLIKNGKTAEEYSKNHNLVDNLQFFIENVSGAGDWDLKQISAWQYPYGTLNGRKLTGQHNGF